MTENANELLELLNAYHASDEENEAHRVEIIGFINNCENVFGKSNLKGHVTASAWILNGDQTEVLMTHHKKLNRWLQLGGHTEPFEMIRDAALREAMEESGLKTLEVVSSDIFDVDVHLIPDHNLVKAHFHYDIRFLFQVKACEDICISDESHDLKWIPLDEITSYTKERSITRMLHKTLNSICILG